jgi:hypothetical protein
MQTKFVILSEADASEAQQLRSRRIPIAQGEAGSKDWSNV